MKSKSLTLVNGQSPRWYRGPNIPMRVIRRFARQVAERFRPDKIILFGSYAYGKPHADSDVDLLVVMPARNQLDQAIKISMAVEAPFPLDIIVRTPHTLAWRIKEGDWFLREIVGQGKVLYAKDDRRMGRQSGKRLPGRPDARPKARTISCRFASIANSRLRNI